MCSLCVNAHMFLQAELCFMVKRIFLYLKTKRKGSSLRISQMAIIGRLRALYRVGREQNIMTAERMGSTRSAVVTAVTGPTGTTGPAGIVSVRIAPCLR